MDMRTIAVVNQKGGVGKSTTAVNLGACMAHFQKKVLVVDSDPQGNCSSGLGISKEKRKRCIYDCLINDDPLRDLILETAIANLSCVPANIELAGAEIELVTVMSREARLKSALDKVRENYDYVIIDCPPSLGLLTLNALTAADEVLVPIQCEYYALEGLGQLLNTINLVKKHLNTELKIGGVLMTMYDARTNLSQQVVDEVKEHFGDKLFKTLIPRNVRLSEAPSFGQPILLYDPKSKGCDAYMDLAQEVILRG
jgi:chromosome partitioning protein